MKMMKKAQKDIKTQRKRKTITCAATVLTATMLLTTGCTSSTPPDDGTHSSESRATEQETYTYRTDVGAYLAAMQTKDQAYLMLVNKVSTIGASYAPAHVTTMSPSLTLYGKEILLESQVALAAEAMLREMWAYGWTDIVITSGYRTYAYQSSLFNTYLDQEQKAHPDWTYAQCRAKVLTYSAEPGTSEHQTGLCMDLIVNDGTPSLDESFASHPAYAWLQQNAHKFGFILRFPKGMEGVTGYEYEPWHYRFVGIEAATAIHNAGLTLEEYLAR